MAILHLCDAAFVRSVHKNFSGTTSDTALTVLIGAVSKRIEAHLGYGLLLEERTEVLDVEPGQRIVRLNAMPLVSVASVKTSSERDFATSGAYTSYTQNEEYAVDLVLGRILFDYSIIHGKRVLQVVHTGGLAADTSDAIDLYPDLALACAMQVIHTYQTAPNFGVTSHGGNLGSRSFEEGAALIKAVRDYLQPYERISYA